MCRLRDTRDLAIHLVRSPFVRHISQLQNVDLRFEDDATSEWETEVDTGSLNSTESGEGERSHLPDGDVVALDNYMKTVLGQKRRREE